MVIPFIPLIGLCQHHNLCLPHIFCCLAYKVKLSLPFLYSESIIDVPVALFSSTKQCKVSICLFKISQFS